MWEFLCRRVKWIPIQFFNGRELDWYLFSCCDSMCLFLRSKWSRKMWQPCNVRMIFVSIVLDNTLLRRLQVLHQKIWIFWGFLPYDKNSICLDKARQQQILDVYFYPAPSLTFIHLALGPSWPYSLAFRLNFVGPRKLEWVSWLALYYAV